VATYLLPKVPSVVYVYSRYIILSVYLLRLCVLCFPGVGFFSFNREERRRRVGSEASKFVKNFAKISCKNNSI